MIKSEFIEILKERQIKTGWSSTCFHNMGTDDLWTWFEPTIDGLQPRIDLSMDGKVVFIQSDLYDNDGEKRKEFTYEEFMRFHRI